MAKTQKERADQSAQILAKKRKAARDIGKLPKVVDPARKDACRLDLRKFCEIYQADIFNLQWSPDHLLVIATMQRTALEGGLYAMAMPRGSGKSKLCDAAAVWAVLYGHRSFVVLIGATEGKGKDRIEALKDTLTNNSLIAADFPEVCYPIAKLERATNRCRQQTQEGRFTQIEWRDKQIRLPIIKGSAASGAVVVASGITGAIRGLQVQVDGQAKRPDLVFADDVQDRKSARNPAQVAHRLKILNGDILGLAGPGMKIACFCPCTVIERDDMAERLLDREKNPAWQGQRIKLMRSMPTDTKLWEEYSELRDECLRAEGHFKRATEFYIAHKAEMDEGADPSWPARYFPDEISAVQSAMNLVFQDEAAFYAEMQNEPLRLQVGELVELKPSDLALKIATNPKLVRGMVPHGTSHLSCYVDVQKEVLFYVVLATQTGKGNEITGAHVVEYGSYPDQKRNYFTLADVKKGSSLSKLYPNLGEEDRIYQGLTDLSNALCERRFEREDQADPMPLSRVIVDSSNWTNVIKKACRNSKYASVLLPAKGWGNDANFSTPMDDWKLKDGMRRGFSWRLDTIPSRHITIGTNNWKTFTAARLQTAPGLQGSLTFYRAPESQHRMLFDHIAAEQGHPRECHGRMVTIWKPKPGFTDNHLLDCLVGSFVGASEQGALGTGHVAPPKKKKAQVRRVAECVW